MKYLTISPVTFALCFSLFTKSSIAQEAHSLELPKDNNQTLVITGLSPQPILPPQSIHINKTKDLAATCFCIISYDDLHYKLQRTGVCYDLTQAVNKTYSGVNQQGSANQNDCKARCNATVASLISVETQKIADCACAAGKPTGTPLRGYSAVGTKAYVVANESMGKLQNTPEIKVTTCKCPTGWLSNTNIDGGVTTDGKCKKHVGTITSNILPPDGTALGTWGFTWGNGIWAYGSVANGGEPACTTVVTQPNVCKLVK
jgi:hypothetical protein